MRRQNAEHRIQNVFLILIFAVFASAMLFVLLLGANSYQKVSASTGAAYDQRVCLDYLGAKIRHHDEAGAIFCADFDNPAASAENAAIPTLYLRDQFNGIDYDTRIYLYDGYMRELFAESGLEFTPDAGTKVLPATELTFTEHDGLIDVFCVSNDVGQRLLVSPRGGEVIR